jgi:hypothetical protein
VLSVYLACISALGTLDYVERTTEVAFSRVVERGDATFHLTGADYRVVMRKTAYAIAHYASEDGIDSAGQQAPAEWRKAFIGHPKDKMIVFHGVYRKVPARGIRWSWRQNFKSVGESPHKEFIAAFHRSFRRGERLYFTVDEAGKLTVHHDEELLGTWDDPSLVRALWAMCLGEKSETVSPDNLVSIVPWPETPGS